MYPAPSDIKYDARFASSSVLPTRPRGTRLAAASTPTPGGATRDHAPWVGRGPGAMALNRILWRAHSPASDRVSTSTAAFAIADGSTYAEPVHAYVVMIDSTEPPVPCSIICFPTASVQL